MMASEMVDVGTLRQIKRELNEFLTTNFLYDGASPRLRDDTSLVADGVVDPTGLIEFVLWIEEAYGFEVPEEDITPQHFDSIETTSRYILRRLEEE